MATVVSACGGRQQTELETGMLEGMGYQVHYLSGLSRPNGLVHAGALMVTVPEVMDAAALAVTVHAGEMAGAALDVLDAEPPRSPASQRVTAKG